MLNLWALVIGATPVVAGFHGSISSSVLLTFRVCLSGEARPNPLKLYVLLARPAPDQTCIPGRFSVCPTSGNVKQACPHHTSRRECSWTQPFHLTHLMTCVHLYSCVFPSLRLDFASEPFPSPVSACLNGVLFWNHLSHGLSLLWSASGTPGGVPNAASLAGFL